MRTPRTRFTPRSSKRLFNGVRHIYQIGPHEVSVICHQYSYGGKAGLWEAMVDDREPKGFLSDEELDAYLAEVAV